MKQDLTHYELQVLRKIKRWEKEMVKPQSGFSKLGKRVQDRINKIIPDKVHKTLTSIIRKMVETVLFTSELIKPAVVDNQTLEVRETLVTKRMEYYRTTAAAEGGITGWAGILGSLADFPALLAIKLKFMFDVASLYGYDTSQLRERIFLLHVFQLAFSSPNRQKDTFTKVAEWAAQPDTIPNDAEQVDWYQFQQDYRDYLDLAKLLQMMPGIGAAVGLIVNYNLMNKLSDTTMMCYRMRWLHDEETNLIASPENKIEK